MKLEYQMTYMELATSPPRCHQYSTRHTPLLRRSICVLRCDGGTAARGDRYGTSKIPGSGIPYLAVSFEKVSFSPLGERNMTRNG